MLRGVSEGCNTFVAYLETSDSTPWGDVLLFEVWYNVAIHVEEVVR